MGTLVNEVGMVSRDGTWCWVHRTDQHPAQGCDKVAAYLQRRREERMANRSTNGETEKSTAVKTTTAPGTPARRKPGPKPKAASAAGHGIPIVVLLQQELASTEAVAGRLRKALQALEA